MKEARKRISQQATIIVTILFTSIATVILAIVSWFVAKDTVDKLGKDRGKKKDQSF